MLTKRILILLPAAAAWAVAVLLVASPAAKATVRSWNGGTSAEWNNAANWGGGVVPGSGDIAEFKTAYANQPTINTGGLSLGEIWEAPGLGQNVTIGADGSADPFTLNGVRGIGIEMDVRRRNLTVNAPVTLGGTQTWVNNGGALTVGNVANGGYTLTVAGSGASNVSGSLSGAGGLVKLGGGTLVFAGMNSYGGGTTIASGTLQLGNGGTMGSIIGNVTDNGTLAFNRSDTYIYSGDVSGTGGVTHLGSGTVVLAGDNTYSGRTTIASGTIQVGNGGTTGSLLGSVTNNGMLVVNCSDACTVAGPINGSGGVVAAGSGTLVLAGADTYSGGTTLLAGTLAIKNASSLGAGPVMLSGGELDNTSAAPVTLSTTKPETWNGDFGFVGTQNLSLGTAAVTLSGSGDRQVTVARGTLTTNGPIGGSNGLVKAGPGALALGGKNTYSGGTTVNGGTLAVRAGARLGAAGGPLVVNNLNTGPGTAVVVNLDSAQTVGGLGGTLATPASGTNTAAVNLNGKSVILTVNPGTGGTYAGALTGSGGLVKAGFGLLALAGVGTYTGGTTLSAGTLGIDSALALGTGKLVIDGGALDNTTATGVTVSTNNAQTWKADFSFVGTQDLNLGTGAVALSGNRDVTIQAGTLGIGGVISGRYGLTKAGSGTLALDGANTYTGGTTLTAGRLVVAGSMGGAAIRAQGGVLENDGTIVGATMVGPGALAQGTGRYGPVTIQSGGTFSPGNGIGQVTSGPTAWYGGGGYHLDLGDATGTAGSGWDLWNIVGGLSLAATAGGLCTIDLEGPASHFDNTSPDSWLIATATGGISGFNSADFVVDQLSSLPLAGGHFAMSESGNALYLDFVPDPAAPAPGLSSATGRVAMPAGFGSLNAVPEPSTLLLLTAGFIGLTGFAWRQRKRTAPGIVPMP